MQSFTWHWNDWRNHCLHRALSAHHVLICRAAAFWQGRQASSAQVPPTKRSGIRSPIHSSQALLPWGMWILKCWFLSLKVMITLPFSALLPCVCPLSLCRHANASQEVRLRGETSVRAQTWPPGLDHQEPHPRTTVWEVCGRHLTLLPGLAQKKLTEGSDSGSATSHPLVSKLYLVLQTVTQQPQAWLALFQLHLGPCHVEVSMMGWHHGW